MLALALPRGRYLSWPWQVATLSTNNTSSDNTMDVGETINAALSLAVSVLVVSHWSWTALRSRRIQLPSDLQHARAIVEDDDINVVAKEVLLSEPVQEEQYRTRVRAQRRRLLFWCSAGAVLAVATLVNLVSIDAPPSASLALASDALLWVTALALLLLPLQAQGQWPHILQLNALLVVSVLTHIIRIVVPPPLEWDKHTNQPFQPPSLFSGRLLWLQVAATFVASAAFIVNGLTPSGPRRVVPSPQPGTVPTKAVTTDEEGGASMLGYLYFTSCTPVVKASYKNGTLSPDDVPCLSDSFRASKLYLSTQQALAQLSLKDTTNRADQSASHRTWRLLRVLLSTNRTLIIAIMCCTAISATSFYVPWILMWLIINSFERSERNHEPLSIAFRQNIVYAVAFGLGSIVCALVVNHAWGMATVHLRSRFRSQLSVLLLNKSLRRKDATSLKDKDEENESDAKSPKQSGDDAVEQSPGEFATKSKIITLQTVDIQRVEEFSMHVFVVINCPVELITGTTLACKVLGVSALIGLAFSFLTAPIVYLIARRSQKVQEKLMVARDSRSSYMNESFQAMRMVKFSSWERRVIENIMKARRAELSHQRNQYILDALNEFFFFMSPMLMIVAAFTCYAIVFHQELTPSRAFTALAVLQELRFALTQIPETISSAIQSWTSLKRIAAYLGCPEVDVPDSIDLSSQAAREADGKVGLQNATIGWPVARTPAASSQAGSVTPAFRLRDISVEFKPKTLTLICGRLGSGKSLLLQGLLGEADLLAGSLQCPRSTPDAIAQSGDTRIYARGEWISPVLTAYVPQSAFLTNNSLRANILFGLPMIQERYDAVLEACALVPDLAIFEDGDQVEIGEGGIGLSGGQKARVSLARAVYSRAQTLLLDDVLSAVDAHTAAHIYTRLIQGPLMKDRTVILVSHQIQLVAPSSELVVVLDNGMVKYQGSSSEFLQSHHYRGLLEDEKEGTGKEDDDNGAVDDVDKIAKQVDVEKAPTPAKEDAPGKAPPRKLVEDEGRNVGAIGLDVWKRYLQMAGGLRLIPVLIALLLPSIWSIVSTSWLRAFSADVTGPKTHPVTYWMSRYAVLVSIECTLQLIRWLAAFSASLRASRVLFEQALNAVFRAPMRFHDTVPRGRLLNRFTNDQEEVDSSLITNLMYLIGGVFTVLSSIVAVCIGGGPIFLVVVVVLAPFYYMAAKVFAAAARDIRRLQQTAKSPLVQSFADCVNGVVVFRAFGASATTLKRFFDQVDDAAKYAYYNRQCNRWLNMTYSLATGVLYFCATTFIMLTGASAALAAFALTFLFSMGHEFFFVTLTYSENETKGVAVERLVEYADVKPEADLIVEPRPPPSWPHAGEIKFNDLRVRYAPELPEVLKGVSFFAPAGSKIGIVGPTGCGKSTTVTSLFRFVEFAGGSIEIDGIDISKIGLEDLRSRLQIVPQDPVILSGTLRDSVDVFHEHTDEEVVAALTKVHLIGPGSATTQANESSMSRVANGNGNLQNANVFEDLSYTIAESGSNLSNGQRQLLCMARALLNRSKVVVFDEASSSTDAETDEAITATLQDEFAACTVITIAHRLRTIMHSDTVVVMDAGRVVEAASPAELLERPGSAFAKLCAASGRAELEKSEGDGRVAEHEYDECGLEHGDDDAVRVDL